MIVVVDASAAMEIALNREYGAQFKEVLKNSDVAISPDTFPSEITNAFWKYASHSELSMDICEKGIEYCLDLVDDFINTKSLCREVFAEALRNHHPVYDLFYLVLARRNNAFIITRDKKLKQIAKRMTVGIIERI